MSQIMTGKKIFILLVIAIMAVAGCGTSNDQSAFDPDTQKHPDAWLPALHATSAQTDIASCKECHGDDLLGGISGKSCSACHFNGMIALTGCTSCHDKPPTGGVYPNRGGRHASHRALLNVAGVCETCHNGAGISTARHYNGVVDTQVLSVYNAKSGAAVGNADGTCSSVSCHGGKTTPVWLTGVIDVDTECGTCHAFGSAEYNSYISGRHDSHVNTYQFPCTRCHDTAKLAVSHFTSLNTSTMEGPASATLNSSLTYTGGSCTPLCHDTRSW